MSSTTSLIKAIIERIVGERLDYLALYPARVVSQSIIDGSLDVQPDDTRLPPMQNVPIRYGVPGVRAEVSAGAQVLIGFEQGNPSRPVATLWDLTACRLFFNGGTHSVAREGDDVDGGTLKMCKLKPEIIASNPTVLGAFAALTIFKYEPKDPSKQAVLFGVPFLPDGILPVPIPLPDSAFELKASIPYSGLILENGIDVKA
jgi:hypothetical protein